MNKEVKINVLLWLLALVFAIPANFWYPGRDIYFTPREIHDMLAREIHDMLGGKCEKVQVRRPPF